MSVDDVAFQSLKSWLDKAAASDYLPEKTGYAFSSATSLFSQTEGDETESQLGVARLHELAVRYSEMKKEFDHSAILQRKKRTYLELFHPFQLTVLHGKWFRLISIAEIAAIEALYWHKTHLALRSTTAKPLPPAITIVLADAEFDKQTNLFMEQIHAFLDLPGPPALPTLHDEITRSFFTIPLSQFTAQLLASSTNHFRGSIIVSACDHHSSTDYHALLTRLEWLCTEQHGTGFAPRIILRVPSYGGPSTSMTMFTSSSETTCFFTNPSGFQRNYRVTLANQHEHERIVLARNGIQDLFTKGFVIGSDRDKDYLRLFVRSCEIDLEWNNSEIQLGFNKLKQVSVDGSIVSPQQTIDPHFLGMLSAAPWSELDEYRLSTSGVVVEETLSDFISSKKYEVGPESKIIVFTDSLESLSLLEEETKNKLAFSENVLSFVNLQDPTICSRLHREPLDWLDKTQFVIIWFSGNENIETGMSFALLDRLLYFVSCIRCKELSGFTLHTNRQSFLDCFIAEKDRRDEYLQTHFYLKRRIRTFPSYCVNGTSDRDLVSYIRSKEIV